MQTVLITGASSGLGAIFAQKFLKDGYHVIVTARNLAQLEALVADYPQEQWTIIQQDLSSQNGATLLYEAIHRRKLTVDILINNAGFGLMGEFHALSLTQQLAMMQVNMTSLVELSYLFLGDMEAQGGGKILNVASVAGYLPGPMMVIYYATKAFVLSFSQALAEEYRGTPIQISVLAPGATKTNFAQVARVEKTKMFAVPMAAEKVVSIAYKQFLRGKHTIIPGKMNQALVVATKLVPRPLLARVAKAVTRD